MVSASIDGDYYTSEKKSLYYDKIITKEGGDKMQFTGIIKKSGDCYVALCLELNIASQGESIEESKNMLQEACEEYLSYMKEKGLEHEIQPVHLDLLREFLIGDVDYVKPSREWKYSESITFMVSASV